MLPRYHRRGAEDAKTTWHERTDREHPLRPPRLCGETIMTAGALRSKAAPKLIRGLDPRIQKLLLSHPSLAYFPMKCYHHAARTRTSPAGNHAMTSDSSPEAGAQPGGSRARQPPQRRQVARAEDRGRPDEKDQTNPRSCAETGSWRWSRFTFRCTFTRIAPSVARSAAWP